MKRGALKTNSFANVDGKRPGLRVVQKAQLRGLLFKLIDAVREEYDAVDKGSNAEWSFAKEKLKERIGEVLGFFDDVTTGGD